MPKIASNQLTILPLEDGWFFLSGYINGARVRLKNKDLGVLEKKKSDLEHDATMAAQLEASKPLPQYTRLSPELIQQAERLFGEFKDLPRPLAEYVRAGVGIIGNGSLVLCTDALERWRLHQINEEKLDEEMTVKKNQRIMENFLADSKAEYVSDITAAAIEAFCSLGKIEARNEEAGASMFTKIKRGSVVRAFLNYCVTTKIIMQSPFALDMKKTLKLAKKDKERPILLNPEQCKKLLQAAIEHDPRYIPYIVVSLWCFVRPSEAKRIKPEDVKLDRSTPFIEPASNKAGTASYRTTNIPTNVLPLLRSCIESGLWAKGTTPFFSTTSWKNLRGRAGLLEFGPYQSKGFRPVLKSYWQPHILRHTGISMLYQHFSDLADKGQFKEESVIAAVTRQAGNSEDVAFEHYINIADAAQAAEFYKITGRLKKAVAQFPAQAVA